MLEDGSDESSFRCLRRFFFFFRFFFFALESNEDVSDESYDEDSGSGVTFGLCLSSCFELSVDRVSGLLCKVFIKSVFRVSGIFSVSRSKNYLVSNSEFFI